MSTENHAANTDSEFFPENVEFLGFVGAWNCYTALDSVRKLFYLIRTKDRDWLEEVTKRSNKIVTRNCVMSIPRHGSKREAAAWLLDAHVRSRVDRECPVPPSRPGLLTDDELRNLVLAIGDELERPAGWPKSSDGPK